MPASTQQLENHYVHTEIEAPRWASLVAGLALGAMGLRHGRLPSALMFGAGSVLIYRSLFKGESGSLPAFARGQRIRASVFVDARPEDCYGKWRRLEELPAFLDFIDRVEVLSPSRSIWMTKPVARHALEWETEIIRDVPGELIGWRSLPGAAVKTAGSIRFQPRGDGTQVTIAMKYHTSADLVADTLMSVLGKDPESQIAEMLGRFKEAVENAGSNAMRKFEDPVDEALDESFPASDPPAFTH